MLHTYQALIRVSVTRSRKHDNFFEDEQLTVEVSTFADSTEISGRRTAGQDALADVIDVTSGIPFLQDLPGELDLVIERVERRDDP